MPARIPLPTDDELTPDHREMLAKVPPLNVFRMVAGTRRGLRPFLQLGAAALSSSMDARRREIAVLRSRMPPAPVTSGHSTSGWLGWQG